MLILTVCLPKTSSISIFSANFFFHIQYCLGTPVRLSASICFHLYKWIQYLLSSSLVLHLHLGNCHWHHATCLHTPLGSTLPHHLVLLLFLTFHNFQNLIYNHLHLFHLYDSSLTGVGIGHPPEERNFFCLGPST